MAGAGRCVKDSHVPSEEDPERAWTLGTITERISPGDLHCRNARKDESS
jgi:hypothetical protein